MKSTENRYSFSFISGALYLKECLAVARLFRQHGDWVIVRDKLIADNLLRQRSRESSVRLFREIRYRLQELTVKELAYLCDADPQDQRHLLFIAVCLHYRFIREFIQEVLLPKALSSDLQLYPGDIGRFFESKGNEPEVERLKPSSRAKVGQVLIRMLVEGGLLDSAQSQRIVRSFPSRALARVVVNGDAVRLRFLLLTDSDIRELKGRHAE